MSLAFNCVSKVLPYFIMAFITVRIHSAYVSLGLMDLRQDAKMSIEQKIKALIVQHRNNEKFFTRKKKENAKREQNLILISIHLDPSTFFLQSFFFSKKLSVTEE